VHLLSRIALIAAECRSDEHAEALSREAEALFELARQEHEGPSLERLEEEMAKTRAAILDARSRPGQSLTDAVDSVAAEQARRQLRE
jgi:hypothetical protein